MNSKLCTIRALGTGLLLVASAHACNFGKIPLDNEGTGGSEGEDTSGADGGATAGVDGDGTGGVDEAGISGTEGSAETGVACPADAMMCPDGSWVGRTGPDCEFAPCPACKPGDNTTAPDGCNECSCQDDGSWACTERACGGSCVGAECGAPCTACPGDEPKCEGDPTGVCDGAGNCVVGDVDIECSDDPCAPQDATGVGACEKFLGYVWNGSGCEGISGCSCEGSDCDALHPTLEACQGSVPDCQGPWCGGWNPPCPDAANQWCDFPDGSTCGAADESGTCRSRPEGCEKIYQPVCGCDGTTYANACVAHANGVDDVHEGACWEPCVDQTCGDECNPCAPDGDCGVPPEIYTCDFYGQCVSQDAVDCSDPCANRVCGEPCNLCHWNDPACSEDAVVKLCDQDGQCGPEQPAC